MWKTRIFFFGSLIAVTALLMSLGLYSPLTSLLVFGGFMAIYLTMSQNRRQKRLNLLNKVLDPEQFLEATRQQIDITGKKDNKSRALLNIDLAAGHIANGEYEQALEFLDGVDQDKLSHKNNSILIYNINRILCLYKLEYMDQAQLVFEEHFAETTTANAYIKQGLKRVACERFFYLKQYEEFNDLSDELKYSSPDLSLRSRLDLDYRIAQVCDILGDADRAKELYEEIAEGGNELWVAKQARQWLEANSAQLENEA